ncbi:hypothetical protein SAMN04488011_101217 [Palleronia pelagia]|uniref:Uncharacterized protein n=1 Tax=Palleronia pelagia TaxID=387096 RepID=A0A1H8ALJ2_9RHOB|nr:hypothetical protein SAMN04488011_101217 [Palleronia pelagia]
MGPDRNQKRPRRDGAGVFVSAEPEAQTLGFTVLGAVSKRFGSLSDTGVWPSTTGLEEIFLSVILAF